MRQAAESGSKSGVRRALDVLADLGLPASAVADLLAVDAALVRHWYEADEMPAAMFAVVLELGGEQDLLCDVRDQWRRELARCDCDVCQSARDGDPYESLAEAVGVAADIDVERLRAEAGL